MKGKQAAVIIIGVLFLDQALKIYIKTHYFFGEEHNILGNWFKLHFLENEGMAWGMSFGGNFGKLFLTLFRLAAVIWGTFYIRKIVREKYHPGFIACVALIYAGAAGNLIDSMFYGLIFNASDIYTKNVAVLFPAGGGYTSFLHGRVVDMLYFPIIDTVLPSWVPFCGGQRFTFFDPVFNLADASISVGVILLLLFQKKFFPSPEKKTQDTSEEIKGTPIENKRG